MRHAAARTYTSLAVAAVLAALLATVALREPVHKLSVEACKAIVEGIAAPSASIGDGVVGLLIVWPTLCLQ